MPDNNNHMQFYGLSCSSELPFTDNSVVWGENSFAFQAKILYQESCHEIFMYSEFVEVLF